MLTAYLFWLELWLWYLTERTAPAPKPPLTPPLTPITDLAQWRRDHPVRGAAA